MTENKTRFEPGQRVIISKKLGKSVGGDSYYYHQYASSNYVPVGTIATISHVEGEYKVHLIFDGQNYGQGLPEGWLAHPDELLITEDEKDKRIEIGDRVKVIEARGIKEGQYRYGYSVSTIPIGTTGIILGTFRDDIRVRVDHSHSYMFSRKELTFNKELQTNDLSDEGLDSLLNAEEPVKDASSTQEIFEPKFNIREEFAIWIREQFPKLREYAIKKEICPQVNERKEEILDGVEKAYEHISTSYTRSCARSSFEALYKNLRGNKNSDITLNLENFVGFIESTSPNMHAAYRHHGINLEGYG